MKIQAITPVKLFNSNQNNQKTVQQKPLIQSYSYNPIAYNDLVFTGRLFRSPEDFYSCSWNKNGMPETMKQYLNADYEDRQHMPPQQMLALVFDDINETKSLEQVKRLYPDEPLFKNLSDEPNRKARSGILAEIDLMKEDGHSLFKNGKDNLGHYILKKIYVEGKTLKEVNEDFSKDKSVYYDGLSPIEYDTLSAFGIKFPNNAFWKSFTHNRDNFNYTYTPRKPMEHATNKTASTVNRSTTSSKPRQRGRFEGVKDWELDKLSDAITKGGGSVTETKKQLKKANIKDDAQLNFVAKYLGEINSIVLEKLHVSPEMREFFENQDNLTKSQKQKLDAYWKDDDRRYWRSVIMKQTIKLFMDDYGVDGQNEDFAALLDYAHSIKPNRLAKMAEHDKLQAEYEEVFANYNYGEEEPQITKNIEETAETKQKSFEESLDEAKAKFGADEYVFKTEKGDVRVVGKLDEALKELAEESSYFLPNAFARKYVDFMMNNDKIDDSYILSKSLLKAGVKLPDDDRLMSEDKVAEMDQKLNDEFFENCNIPESRAAQQAISEVLLGINCNGAIKPNILNIDLNCFMGSELINNSVVRSAIMKNKSKINEKYNLYKKPLSVQEVYKISLKYLDMLRKYDLNKSSLKGYDDNFGEIINTIARISKGEYSATFKLGIRKFVRDFGGSARFLLDKNASEELKNAKMERMTLAYASVLCNQ